MKATLNTPATLDPTQFVGINLVSATMLFANKGLQLSYELTDANGKVVARKTVNVATVASQTYVSNQEQALLQKLMTALGLAATIA